MVTTNSNSLNTSSRLQSLFQSCRQRGQMVKPLPGPGTGRANAGGTRTAHLAGGALAAALLLPAFSMAAHGGEGRGANVPAAGGRDPVSCQTVRFSDVGWTDVTATTALVTQLLRSIGYSPTVTVLSVPVTFASLQNRDIDVFLGNWMPAQDADRHRYVEDGSIVVIGANLSGAKYTL